MILYDDCKKCIYGSTVKCESGDEYIVCSMWPCSEEKMKSAEHNDSILAAYEALLTLRGEE